MRESRVSRARGPRPRRPSFVEHVTSVTVQNAPAEPPSAGAPMQGPTPAASSANAPRPISASPPPSGSAQERLVEADDANRPHVGSERLAMAGPSTDGSSGGPTSAMWLLVALVMGLAIGAVSGTVAALVVFG